MPTICIQCAMRAILEGRDRPAFPESPEEHVKRYHADPKATAEERRFLEEEILKHFARQPKPKD